jgi:hypothetical protein
VCFKLDRLGRSLSHLAQLIDEFNTHKLALVVPAQGIDTSEGNPASKLQLHILCAVAEFEREMIRERVNARTGRSEEEKGSDLAVLPHWMRTVMISPVCGRWARREGQSQRSWEFQLAASFRSLGN